MLRAMQLNPHKPNGTVMTRRTYEITFRGEAVPAIVETLEEFDVMVGTEKTILRAEQIDQAALHGAMDRLWALGLELLEVRALEPPHPQQEGGADPHSR